MYNMSLHPIWISQFFLRHRSFAFEVTAEMIKATGKADITQLKTAEIKRVRFLWVVVNIFYNLSTILMKDCYI